MEALAADVAVFLKNERFSVRVEKFSGSANSSSGRMLQHKLSSALKSRGIEVLQNGADADAGIQGRFSVSFQDEGAIILIEVNIVDRLGKDLGSNRKTALAENAASLEDVASLFPTNFDFDKKNDDEGSNKLASHENDTNKRTDESTESATSTSEKIKEAILAPNFAFINDSQTRIAPKESSQFQMEVLVRNDKHSEFRELMFLNSGGFPFAELAAGNEYQIQIHNLSNHPIGVKLAVDGINCLALSENAEFRQHGMWVVNAKSTEVISGWHITEKDIRPFLVTAGDRYLGLPEPGDTGTITALVFRADLVSATTENSLDRYASSRAFPVRTTAGDLKSHFTSETLVRFSSTMLASLSFQYTNPTDLPE